MHLSLRGVTKSFTGRDGKIAALSEVNLEIPPGSFVCLVGPSGCGKTTLLNLIAGFETPSTGQVLADDRAIVGPGPDRVVLFQDPALFPWLSVEENVAFPLRDSGIDASETRRRVEEALRLVHLYRFKGAQPHELSGGMRARAAIARALVMEPEVMLLDEPFAALDAHTRELLQQELERAWQRTGATMVFITHDNREAVRLATHVIVMGTRPGRVKLQLDVERDLPRPRDPYDRNLSLLVTRVARELSAEIEKIAREESDEVPPPATPRPRTEPDFGRDI
ncbi:MAG: ABC transporter ATP-binding protein [Myxococcales bacterium]|nr:ABC transporter ATP-binding protein [Myxococcales bacterium]MCB9577695.1 ABC transporter ATP-binding protein [Polyangiaceae bacterium]